MTVSIALHGSKCYLVWSFGVCCYEILMQREPYEGMDAVQVATAVVSEKLKPDLPVDGFPADLLQIISSCYEYEPEDRPTFEELNIQLKGIRG